MIRRPFCVLLGYAYSGLCGDARRSPTRATFARSNFPIGPLLSLSPGRRTCRRYLCYLMRYV